MRRGESQETNLIVPEDQARLKSLATAASQISLIDYIRHVAPWFIIDAVHVAICWHLEAMARREFDRLMLHQCPRTGKSMILSVFFPSWAFGLYPSAKVLGCSHSIDLVEGFSRQALDLIQSPAYAEIFPHVVVTRQAVKHWTISNEDEPTAPEGEYNIGGVQKKLAGKGFNIGIIDDPMSEQDYLSDKIKPKIWNWYTAGFYTRRQLEWNLIAVMATRWAWDDLPGRIIELSEESGEHWEVLSIPAILDRPSVVLLNGLSKFDHQYASEKNPPLEVGGSFMPKRLSMEEIDRSKATMVPRDFTAQYLQRPSDEEGSIFKRSMFQRWPAGKDTPQPIQIVTFYDTAFEEDEADDMMGKITMGVFEGVVSGPKGEERYRRKAIILGAKREHVAAADLYEEAVENHKHWSKFGAPHLTSVEKRASGIQLIQELRRTRSPRVPVHAWLPSRYGLPRGARSKIPRAHAAAIPTQLGDIYIPAGLDWAELLIDDLVKFPLGQWDDLVDAYTMCVLFFRWHYLLDLPLDEEDEDEKEPPTVNAGGKKKLGYGSL